MNAVDQFKKRHVILSQKALILTLALFQSLSSSWPSSPGTPEVLVGASLILLFYRLYLPTGRNLFFLTWFYLLALLGTIISILQSNNFIDYVRDFLPFIYMALPTLLFFKPRKFDIDVDLLSHSLIFISLVYSYRVLENWIGIHGWDFFNEGFLLSVAYLAQAPALLFGAIASTLLLFFDRQKSFMVTFIYLVISLSCLVIFYLQVLRAPLLFQLGSPILFLALSRRITWNNKAIILSFLGVFLIFIFMIVDVDLLFGKIIQKFVVYGFNGKIQEYTKLFEYLSDSLLGVLGTGFGGLWPSPFEPDRLISYTHSLPNYLFLKFGLFGLVYTAFYITFFSYIFMRLFTKKLKPRFLAIAISCFLCFCTNIFLEPGFKSVEFNLILTVLIGIYGALENENSSRNAVLLPRKLRNK